MADARARLTKIDAELYYLENDSTKYIAALEAAEAILVERLSHLVYPILTLPPAITAQIFLACLPAHGRVRMSSEAAPLKLSWVCRQWREIALATPELWVSQDVELRLLHKGKKSQLWPGGKDLFETCLARAQASRICPRPPISLTIRQNDKVDNRMLGSSLAPLSPYLKDAVPHVWRLEADISPTQLRQIRPLGSSLPHLEHLTAALIAQDLADIVQHAPKLRELHLRKYPVNAKLSSPVLVKLEVLLPDAEISLDALLDILEGCPMLEYLHTPLEPAHPTSKPYLSKLSARTHILHPNLRDLAISSPSHEVVKDSAQSLCALFQFLTAPALHSLDILVPLHSETVLDIARCFLCRSDCRIVNVRLTVTPYDASSWISMFSALESLDFIAHPTSKNCTYPFVDGDTLNQFPRLRRVSFSFETRSLRSEVDIDWDALLEILRMRKELDSERKRADRTGKFEPTPLESFRISTIWHKKVYSCSTWLPPDTLFASAESGSAVEILRMAEQISIFQKVRAPENDYDWEDFYNKHDGVDRDGDSEWPDREMDDKCKEWCVRRWPESFVRASERAGPADAAEPADPYAEFRLHLDPGQVFKKAVVYSSESESEWDDHPKSECDSQCGSDAEDEHSHEYYAWGERIRR
ncbi:hypothetical protein C8F01DRAFT_117878 [Mycena amicta]|nr:hypothetical protein C8F01DRAFT_117878 [Mycena amicta]